MKNILALCFLATSISLTFAQKMPWGQHIITPSDWEPVRAFEKDSFFMIDNAAKPTGRFEIFSDTATGLLYLKVEFQMQNGTTYWATSEFGNKECSPKVSTKDLKKTLTGYKKEEFKTSERLRLIYRLPKAKPVTQNSGTGLLFCFSVSLESKLTNSIMYTNDVISFSQSIGI